MAEESSLAIIDAKESYLAKPSTVGLLIYDEATFWLNYFLRTSTPEIPLTSNTPALFKALIRFGKSYFSRTCYFLEQLIFDC